MTLGAVTAGVLAYTRESGVLNDRRAEIAEETARRIEVRLAWESAVLSGARGLIEAELSRGLAEEEFRRWYATVDASLAIDLSWRPRVTAAERAAWERRHGVAIRESGPNGLQRAGRRREHFPVLFAEPRGVETPLRGFDTASENDRAAAIVRARDSGGVAMSPPVSLLRGGKGLLLIQAVYAGDVPNTADERLARFAGVVAGVAPARQLAEAVVADLPQIAWLEVVAGGESLLDSPPPDDPIAEAPVEFATGGQGLTVRVAPHLHRSWVSVVLVGIAGALVGTFVVWVLVATHRRAREAELMAAHDSLTGLPNHRVFQEVTAAEVMRAQRYGRSMSIAIIDIDHFKRVNDSYGHQEGDRVLEAIAEILRRTCRTGEIIARVGGEEFGWVLPETDSFGAWQAGERVRQAISEAPIGEIGRVTVSIGVCEVRPDDDPDAVIRRADSALYWAKSAGRDTVVRYSPHTHEALSAGERAERLRREQSLASLRVLARAVDAKDPSTQAHSVRVATLAVQLATALDWTPDRVASLHEAALVHDVGKIGVPDAILFKPGRLDEVEYSEVKRHAALGAEMVAEVFTESQVRWVRHHHERFDGSGYPDGIAGTVIPEGARIIALADAWDVMRSMRSYGAPVSVGDAMEEIERCSGSQFCPTVVDAARRLHHAGVLAGDEPPPTPTPGARERAIA